MGSVVTFYRFVEIDDPDALRGAIDVSARDAGIVGTCLIAAEGINATFAHDRREVLEALVESLRADVRFTGMPLKWSSSRAGNPVFNRLKVRVKPEIVSFGGPIEPGRRRGECVDAERWNALLADPDVVVLDTRNDYESDVGSFQGALRPPIRTFREFTQFVDKSFAPNENPRVAMFCTGGIRCEKASLYMLERGFANVYQLDGGILNYLDTVDPAANAWEGECFVFDQRVTLTRDLEQGDYDQCHACRRPISDENKRSARYRPGVSCPHCHEATSERQRASFEERRRQEALARARGTRHVGLRQEHVSETSRDR